MSAPTTMGNTVPVAEHAGTERASRGDNHADGHEDERVAKREPPPRTRYARPRPAQCWETSTGGRRGRRRGVSERARSRGQISRPQSPSWNAPAPPAIPDSRLSGSPDVPRDRDASSRPGTDASDEPVVS